MKELMTGNEAIARGAWEAGIVFASAYPGTPSTEILENVTNYKDIYSEWAPNEKVAVEAAIGASVAGGRSMAAMKHVGLNVAADPLMTCSYTGITGGMIFISADDPGMHSSQNEQDNRYYALLGKFPMLEPSDSQEAKDFVKEAIRLSEEHDAPVMIRMTTRVCHSKSMVELGEREQVAIIPYEKKKKYDPIPVVSKRLHKHIEEVKFVNLEKYSNETPLNFIEWSQDKKIGIITSGVSYQYAKEVFGDTASYLKLGFTNPLPMDKIRAFANEVETLYVIEELEPYLERQIKAAGIDCIGKEKIPILDELNPDIVRRCLLGEVKPTIDYDSSAVIKRLPTLCAGCPHRGIFYQLKQKKNIMISSDIGCYSLCGMEPLRAKDTAFCMGGGFSVAHGAQKVFNMTDTGMRVVGVMGDSTFFHSGMTSLLDAIYNNSNVLEIILDNRITGMTGHQQNPGTGFRIDGEPTYIADIEKIVEALGVKNLRVVNPLDLKAVDEALEWGLSLDEPAVLITRWPCVLKKLSQADKDEFGDYKSINKVDHDKCIGCKMCIKTGCPALSFDKATKKVSIDRAQCVGCDVCAQICPKEAIGREEK